MAATPIPRAPAGRLQALNSGSTVQDVSLPRERRRPDQHRHPHHQRHRRQRPPDQRAARQLVKEDTTGRLTSDSLFVTDVDNPAAFNPATVTGAYGTFSIINAAGNWRYVLNNGGPTSRP